jgi:hypothetical protein
MADKDALKNLNSEPRAYVRIKLIPAGSGGQPIADLPGGGRLPFEPNAQSYEIAREAARRAIQAAMGISPLPTPAQQQNQKSGIALERIQNSEAIGSFHFTDNLNRAKENTGRQLNELITKVMDTPRHVGIREPDETHGLLRVMSQEHFEGQPAPDPNQPESDQLDYLISDRGEFDVTISTGPSFQSQREEASDFADTILKEVQSIAQLLPPQAVAKLLALAIKLKDIGSLGDKMAEIIDPEDQSAQQLAQAQQQLAAQQQNMQEMQAEIQKLQLEKAGKVIDNEYKMQLKQFEGSVDKQIAQLNADLKAYIANVTTKAQDVQERQRLFQETQLENHHAAHEIAMQKDQQGHEAQQAQIAAQQAQQQQAAEHVQQQTMAQQAADQQPQEPQ